MVTLRDGEGDVSMEKINKEAVEFLLKSGAINVQKVLDESKDEELKNCIWEIFNEEFLKRGYKLLSDEERIEINKLFGEEDYGKGERCWYNPNYYVAYFSEEVVKREGISILAIIDAKLEGTKGLMVRLR